MTKQLFFSCLFAACIIAACSKKKENDPSPQNSKTTKDNRLSGFTWTKSTPTGNWLSTSFLDENNGYISGTAGSMIKTTDGGLTYTTITGLPAQDLYGCFFTSVNKGFVVGSNNTAYVTTNGGATWSALSLPVSGIHFRSVYFQDANTGFIGGSNSTILKTIDGGTTWTASNTGITGSANTIYSFVFKDSLGFAGGNYGKIYQTKDAGMNWSLSYTYDSRANITSLTIPSPLPALDTLLFATTGIISGSIGSDNTTYLTYDLNLMLWTTHVIAGPYQVLHSVRGFNINTIYMAGGNVATNTGVLYSTTNSGVSWTTESIPASGRLVSLSAYEFSPGNGVVFAAGLNNSVLKGQ